MVTQLRILAWTIALVLPVSAGVGDNDRFLPLIHDGGGWSTEVTIVNLSGKPAFVMATFLTEKGLLETWKLGLKASKGRISEAAVEAPLEPGASLVVETSGLAPQLTRGYAEVVEYEDKAIGATARLVQRRDGVIVQSITVSRTAGHESRSVVPVNLSDPETALELVWVSPTSSTTLDLRFRNLDGVEVHSHRLQFEATSQMIVDVRATWPELAGFRGTLEWVVSFPTADRYEGRFLSSIALLRSREHWWAAMPSMTLQADQLKTSPY